MFIIHNITLYYTMIISIFTGVCHNYSAVVLEKTAKITFALYILNIYPCAKYVEVHK